MLKVIVGLYVIVTSGALVLLKLGSEHGAPIALSGAKIVLNLNWTIVAAGLLYITSFALYTYLISKFSLGFIIPFTTGLVYVAIFGASYFLFHESFTTFKVIGIMLIMGGIVFLNLK